MSLRVLLLAERDECLLLVRKHVEIEWPEAVIVEHRLGVDAPFDPDFSAAGFAAVVLVGEPPCPALEAMAAELEARPEFAPIVFVALENPPARRPGRDGVHRLYGRKLDRAALVAVLDSAAHEHSLLQAKRRSHPDFGRRYQFGSVVIRGHRFIRQVGSGGMCKIYLAESERAGTVVVLKVFSQVPDVSDRLVGFDRFLQEYEIVAGLKHQNIVTIYDLGVADDHAYIAMEHFPAGDLRQRMKTQLPPTVALQWAGEVAADFSARHSALRREYRYCILNRSARSGLMRTRAAWIHRPIDAVAMQTAAEALHGEHDFSAFRSKECQSKTSVRRVESVSVCRAGDYVWVDISANAYLHHMVRNIVGTLLDVQSATDPAAAMLAVLASGDRGRAGPTAPPGGLYLWQVDYPPAHGIPPPPGGGVFLRPPA